MGFLARQPNYLLKTNRMNKVENMTVSPHSNNAVLPAVPMWTMVAENRYNRSRLHIANETYITLCGRDNMLVRDYVEFQNGNVNKIGECRKVLETIPEWQLCKRCMLSLRHSR